MKHLTPAQRKQITPFRVKVFEALLQVPKGKVTTYKLLADSIDCKSSQAVGQALRHNPFAPEVPCHRVVKSDLSIGGFGGCTKGSNIDKKIQLLIDEGVVVFLDENGKNKNDNDSSSAEAKNMKGQNTNNKKDGKIAIVDGKCIYKF